MPRPEETLGSATSWTPLSYLAKDRIGSVTQGWVVPGAADHANQLLFGGLVVSPGGANDVFLNHDAPQVVGAKMEPDPAHLQSLREPGNLKVAEVVQKQPRYG